ncbi:MAG TPA: hypothetical protein VGE76_16295, partial [Opitutaceae bacterium]
RRRTRQLSFVFVDLFDKDIGAQKEPQPAREYGWRAQFCNIVVWASDFQANPAWGRGYDSSMRTLLTLKRDECSGLSFASKR